MAKTGHLNKPAPPKPKTGKCHSCGGMATHRVQLNQEALYLGGQLDWECKHCTDREALELGALAVTFFLIIFGLVLAFGYAGCQI